MEAGREERQVGAHCLTGSNGGIDARCPVPAFGVPAMCLCRHAHGTGSGSSAQSSMRQAAPTRLRLPARCGAHLQWSQATALPQTPCALWASFPAAHSSWRRSVEQGGGGAGRAAGISGTLGGATQSGRRRYRRSSGRRPGWPSCAAVMPGAPRRVSRSGAEQRWAAGQLQRNWRPSITWHSATAASAAAGEVKVTKPKPRGLPVWRSRMTTCGVRAGPGARSRRLLARPGVLAQRRSSGPGRAQRRPCSPPRPCCHIGRSGGAACLREGAVRAVGVVAAAPRRPGGPPPTSKPPWHPHPPLCPS